MFRELELSESDSMLAAYNAVCELKEETDRLLAACKAKEAELAELRGATAELFAERLEAEGLSDEAVMVAREMWLKDPESVAMVTLGCDIMEAANPYGCNQYGHGFKEPHGAAGGRGQKTFDFFGETVDKKRKKDIAVVEDATRAFKEAKRAEETAYKKWEATSYGTSEYEEAEKAWEKANEVLIQEAKKARRARNEARKNGYELEEAEDKRIDETLRETDREEAIKRETEENSKRFREQMEKRGLRYDKGIRAWVKAIKREENKLSGDTDEVKSSRTLEELLEEADLVESANPYGCNQYGHEWKGKHGEGWKPSGRGGESGKKKDGDNEKKAETPEKKDERKGPPKRPDGSFIIPSIGKAKAIPTYIPKPKGLSEREQLINDTVYRPEWQVRKPVRDEADKALNKLRERLKKEKPGSETWTKYKTHEHSINGFVSRMLNSTTERQRREQMRFLLQYLEHVDKDLNS